jgi:hypothetical protein
MISALKQVKHFALATLHTPRKMQVKFSWTCTKTHISFARTYFKYPGQRNPIFYN